MKKLTVILILLSGLSACQPNADTKEGQEAIRQDSINPTEGEGEGELGKEEIGGYEHNQ